MNAHIKKNHTKRKPTEDLSEPAKRPRLLYGNGVPNLEPEKEKNPQPDSYEDPQPGPSHVEPEKEKNPQLDLYENPQPGPSHQDHQDFAPHSYQIVEGNPDHVIQERSAFKEKLWKENIRSEVKKIR